MQAFQYLINSYLGTPEKENSKPDPIAAKQQGLGSLNTRLSSGQ